MSAIDKEVIKKKEEKLYYSTLKVHTFLKLQNRKHEQLIHFIIAYSLFLCIVW
jgi:hypothetical protein